MNLPEFAFSPPKRLALAYAAPEIRDLFGVMLALDERLGDIIRRATEPLIGQMRLAWWNDVMAKPAGERPLGEPLVAAISALESNVDGEAIKRRAHDLIASWNLLLAHEIWSKEILIEHASRKSTALFEPMLISGGVSDLQKSNATALGAAWALNDLAHYCQNKSQMEAVTASMSKPNTAIRFPRILRPLTILVKSQKYHNTKRSSDGFRLLWHAITGL